VPRSGGASVPGIFLRAHRAPEAPPTHETMSLPIYVTQDKWQDFDDAWTELMASADAPLDELYVALRRAGEKKRITR